MTCVEKRLLFTHPIRTQQTQLPLRPLFDASGRRESNFKYLFGFFSFPFMFCFVLFCLFQPKFEQRRQTIFWLVQTNPIVYRATYALVVCHQTDERCDYILIGPNEKLKMC